MTTPFRTVLIWIAASLVGVVMSLNTLPASYTGEEYLPVGNDSFYHARRILDVATGAQGLYQFDAKIHAPEGSLLTWPWGYDYLMAQFVKLGGALGLSAPPMQRLAYLPTLFVVVAIGLIVAIARQLGMSLTATALAALCFAALPLTQGIYAVGAVDHHFAENLLYLATLLSSLAWLRGADNLKNAAICGCVMGIAPAIQNGLFILQVPLVISLLVLWHRNETPTLRAALAFAIALIVSTLAILIPSQPFRQGEFAFYFLSGFHLYVATGTAAIAYFTSRFQFSRATLAALGLGGVIALAVLGGTLKVGAAFLAGDLDVLPQIVEAQSLIKIIGTSGIKVVLDYYSGLVVLIPFILAACAICAFRRQTAPALVQFCVASAVGLCLLLLQFRLHVFGSAALILPIAFACDRAAPSLFPRHTLRMTALGVLIGTALVMPVQNQLFKTRILANDSYYGPQRPLFSALADACRRNPGIVLAGSDTGHYIRFHTDCSVIANNFLMTRQHAAKHAEAIEALDTRAQALLDEDFTPRYILVSMADVAAYPPSRALTLDNVEALRPRLAFPLLLRDAEQPPRLRLLGEVSLNEHLAFARLYEVVPQGSR